MTAEVRVTLLAVFGLLLDLTDTEIPNTKGALHYTPDCILLFSGRFVFTSPYNTILFCIE